MREIEPRDVHPRRNHPLDRITGLRRRADRAHDLGFGRRQWHRDPFGGGNYSAIVRPTRHDTFERTANDAVFS
jgi:hypothetical protein